MGTGQSRFFNSKESQYPPGAPYSAPPPFQQSYPYPPLNHYAPYGVQPPMFPMPQPVPGYMPQQYYGQQPLFPYYHRDGRKRKSASKRRNSERENFVGGFAPGFGQQERDNLPRRHTEFTGDAPPFIPPREPAPVIPPRGFGLGPTATKRDERPNGPLPDRDRTLLKPTSRFSEPLAATHASAVDPFEPAHPSAYGPGESERPKEPLKNPLPPPPRDIYELTPYKSVLNLPQTTALLTATYGPQKASLVSQPSTKRKSILGGGLFRAFSKKDKDKNKDKQPNVHFIPVAVPPQNDSQAPLSAHDPIPLSRSFSQQTRKSIDPNAAAGPSTLSFGPSSTPTWSNGQATGPFGLEPSPTSDLEGEPGPRRSTVLPVPPIPSSPPAVRFDNSSTFRSLLLHSNHRVMYNGLVYPTGFHLHEAMKFIGYRDDVAEAIRKAKIDDVVELTRRFSDVCKPDYWDKFLEYFDEILMLKLKQHANLRSMLLSTGMARIIYTDTKDAYWGTGEDGKGLNELGKALVRVREKLIREEVG